ncbi:hypothetical protein BCR35DRAFT_260139 [Leucosporidium creatinivorum]|uniref:White collar 1 protein n=1 Tax=Leucosporidium creatinivorum TaxID=106004 RepID=A0A1Y2G4X3_9BASI|nr:hypothetical protein BCR35DRAFT_260139 [Leucosporidium creatinivorum]
MPQAQTKDWTGVYSTTGFDMVSVLAKVASRPNPQIALGPVDLGCSFVVVDAKKWDQPIVFASETFSRLTGYSNVEIIGRNCRFLQAPDGVPVRQGEKRKYTDGNAAHHLRRHLVQGQESQASLINYCKGGKPFINLVTIVPITWDSDEIAYFVGFQVDLVEQPSAIMEKMRDGSYIVNYSLSVNSIPASLEPPQVEPFGDLHPISHSGPMDVDSSGEILRTIGETGVAGLADDGSKKQFNRLLLEHCDDFVHVLSLKGSLLYVSPSAKRLLEYDPSELVGRTLSTICHPSDIVAVLRELKEAGPNSPVNIVYRVRRKNSGYVWLEATGKLHLEQGKGRKCVILVGRPREVYRMSWSDLERLGGFGTTEYWSKLTIGGLYLYSTPSVEKVLGKTSEQMTGTTLAQLSPNGDATEILAALQQAAIGHATTTRHQLLQQFRIYAPVSRRFHPPILRSTGSRSSTSFSAITSTFKQLAPSSSVSDNVFDELDSVRGTSWQFELHQMRLTNKKLREEKEALLAMQRKKRKRAAGGDKLLAPGSSPKNAKRSCANCGRSSSAEWRTGPTGPKTLCNACGLRWSKVRPSLHSNHSSSSGNASASTDSGTPPLIPSMKRSDSRAP